MTSIANAASRRAVRSAQPGQQIDDETPARQQQVRLYRLPDVLARIPVSKSSWFAGIQQGRYPRGHSLSARTTVWRSDDIDQLIADVTAFNASSQEVV